MPGVSDFSCGRATLRPGMIRRFAASDNVTAPCRTLSQSSSVLRYRFHRAACALHRRHRVPDLIGGRIDDRQHQILDGGGRLVLRRVRSGGRLARAAARGDGEKKNGSGRYRHGPATQTSAWRSRYLGTTARPTEGFLTTASGNVQARRRGGAVRFAQELLIRMRMTTARGLTGIVVLALAAASSQCTSTPAAPAERGRGPHDPGAHREGAHGAHRRPAGRLRVRCGERGRRPERRGGDQAHHRRGLDTHRAGRLGARRVVEPPEAAAQDGAGPRQAAGWTGGARALAAGDRGQGARPIPSSGTRTPMRCATKP